jgi:N-acetylneuraminate synthase
MKENVYIIAEAGVNHNGSLEQAKQLVDAAAEAGVDAVKFQSFKAENLVTESASMAGYQKENTGKEETQLEMLKRLELSFQDHVELRNYCNKKQIAFLSTPFDKDSLEMLINEFDLPVIKVSSGDLTNSPLLYEIASRMRPVILSTGMAEMKEIQEALGVLAYGYCGGEKPSVSEFISAFSSDEGRKALEENVTLLHCTTQYPTPVSEVNLNAMNTIRNEFGLKTGYSDHTIGVHVPVAAVAMGATLIEKHFTLDRELPGPDHKASLEPNELKQMVDQIRDIEDALGSSEKKPTPVEMENRTVARKSIIASKEIKAGEEFTEDNLTTKRPEGGLSPNLFWECLGKKAKRDFFSDEKVEL